jgi:hypothetical protein
MGALALSASSTSNRPFVVWSAADDVRVQVSLDPEPCPAPPDVFVDTLANGRGAP